MILKVKKASVQEVHILKYDKIIQNYVMITRAKC
jgi:hypothetical protein